MQLISMSALLGLVVVGGGIFAAAYNGLIKKRIRTEEAWADIDVQLKRRYDLIPNLVETVKGYAKHESETLQKVLEARSKATSTSINVKDVTPEQMAAFSGAQTGLSGALNKLLAVAESYPDLKANKNFLELQKDLTDTEDKIQAARRFFNGTVQEYNMSVETVPTNIIASMFSFKKKEFFELKEDDKAKEPVAVKF